MTSEKPGGSPGAQSPHCVSRNRPGHPLTLDSGLQAENEYPLVTGTGLWAVGWAPV